jgi:hypothetical protein
MHPATSMNIPNFLIIGAARSGTTALCNSLQQHPQIHISPLKEPHFLAFQGQTVNFAGPGDDVLINSQAVTKFDDYQRLFAGVDRETAIGEGSVSTLYYHDSSIDNIRRFTPDARLIVLLRNPIQRAYSSFLYMTAHGYEPLADFERALDQEQRRIDDHWHHIWHYTRMGSYSTQLSRFLDAFGPDRLQILLFDDLKSDPQGTMRGLYTFLDVDPDFPPATSPEVNRSGVPRSRMVQHVLYRVNQHQKVKRLLKAVVPLRLREWVRRANLTRPEMTASARERLKDVYRAEIGQLQQLLNRDLSHWIT